MEYEQINKLKKSFESVKEKRTYHKEPVIQDEDKILAISDLWSRIFFNATTNPVILDSDEISRLKNEFEISTRRNVDLELIHSKYWLRYCLNEIVFPEAIRHHINDLDKVAKFRNELEFLAFIRNKVRRTHELKIEKNVLNILFENHSKIYSKLKIEDFRSKNFKEEDDGSYKLENNYKYHEIADIIGGKLWNLYNEEGTPTNNNTFFEWLKRISFIGDDFWNCTEYMTKNVYKQFLDIALELIENETDIIGWSKECEKLHWENNHYIPLDSSKYIILPEPENKSSLYGKYIWLTDLSKFNHKYPFIDSRESIRFLIHILIRDASKNRNENFVKLLDFSKSRPFLLEYIIFSIYNNYPELIPTLLVYEPTISVGMAIIKKVEFRKDTIDEPDWLLFATKLFKKSFDLALSNIRKLENKPLLLFEILIDLAKDYYYKPYQNNQFTINQKKEIENRLEYVFEAISRDSNLFEEIFNDFISCIYQNTVNSNSETGYLPIPELKILFWLISVIEKKNSSNSTEQLKDTTTCIYNIYINEINRSEIIKNGERKVVRWYRDQEGIETLPWEKFFIHLDSRKLIILCSLYSDIEVNIPEILEDGSKNRNYFDDSLKTTAYKIRLHLYLFIQNYIKLRETAFNNLRLTLEDTLNNLISWYSHDNFKDYKINIFDTHYELSNFGNFTYDLASNIGKLLNVASNKNFIDSIIKNNNDVGFLARILRNTVSESDRKQILAKVDEKNIKEYLKNIHTTTEIEQLLIDLSEEKNKISLLPEIIEFGDNHSNPNNKEWKRFSYTYKLLVAAQTGNMNDIELIHDKNKDIINSFAPDSKKEYEDTYQFYKALCAFNTNPEEGYKLYTHILGKNKKNVTAALNRFASKIRWALQVDINRNELLQSALIEWEEFEQSCSMDELISVKENSILNKLICYYYLTKTVEFDNLWGNINDEIRYSTQLIEIRMDFLKAQGREKDLETYISSIINFHKDSDNKLPEEIKLLIKEDENKKPSLKSNIEVLPNQDLKGLSDAYIQINKKETKEFINIIKSSKLEIETFCVKYLLLPIFERMLDQKILFRGREGENKYTQLAWMLLEEKFSFFDNWVVRTQSFGGKSKTSLRKKSKDASESNMGQRDLIIEHQKRNITIVEALRLNGLNTSKIEEHIECFDSYDNIGLEFYVVLTYYEKENDFHETWEKYKEVIRNYDFKKTKLKSMGKLEELSFGQPRGNIRIAKTEHTRNAYPCNMYHIFVDFGT